MSVDIHDYRKFASAREAEEATAKANAEEAAKLLPQEGSQFEVGDDKLDKLVRAIEPLVQNLEAAIQDLAIKGMGCVQDDVFRACQLNYVYNKGKVDALKEVQNLPKRIIHELSLVKS